MIAFATLLMIALLLSLAASGVYLLRKRPGWRVFGVVLLVEALLLLALQVALSTIPFGIGEPLIRVQFRDLLLQTAAGVLAIAGGAALVWAATRWLLRRGARRRRMTFAAVALLIPVVGSASMYGMTRASLPERERERDPNKREITLLPGFEWSVYAQGSMDNPTTISFDPNGDLYIADIAGTLWKAQDTNDDAAIDMITPWADGFQLLVGLVWRDGELYTASSGKIEALRDADGDGKADQRRVVVDGLPSMILMPHSNNGLAFGPDGRLYFGVGSTTDEQIEQDEYAAAVLSINPDGSDLQVFARGLGNTFDVAFNSAGDLFGGDNSPSGQIAGEDYPDEFNYIVKGGHYGFPYFFGDPPEDNGTRSAVATFPPHSAPSGVTFYSGDTFPSEYRDSAFITLWARGEVMHVEVAKTSGGSYLSRTTTFGSGFLYPIDAVTGPDGNLYIADFGTSAVYRVTYDPDKDLQ